MQNNGTCGPVIQRSLLPGRSVYWALLELRLSLLDVLSADIESDVSPFLSWSTLGFNVLLERWIGEVIRQGRVFILFSAH